MPGEDDVNVVCEHPTKLRLSEFKGDRDQAAVWWSKFELLSTRYNWSDEDKCCNLGFNLSDNAGVWFSTLSADIKSDWTRLSAAFKSNFVECESRLILQSKLQSLSFTSDLDDYYSQVISLGAKLGRSEEDIASAFLNGLPKLCQDFVLATDTHTLGSYVSRCRLFLARNPSKSVSFDQGTFPIANADSMPLGHSIQPHASSDAAKDLTRRTADLCKAVTDSLSRLTINNDDRQP